MKIQGFKKELVAAEVLSSMYDASLDQFLPHSWYIPGIYPSNSLGRSWEGYLNFSVSWDQEWNVINRPARSYILEYDHLLYLGKIQWKTFSPLGVRRESILSSVSDSGKAQNLNTEKTYSIKKQTGSGNPLNLSIDPPIQIRKNFNETAFFLPDLRTDDSGNVEFSFKMPEALTQWKWMSLAHTRDLAFGYKEATIITQKKLMVQPNPPRFLRAGDHIEFPVKIVNMTDSELTGQALLQLIDPTTNQPVDGWFSNRQPNQYFTAGAQQSTTVYFPIDVPFEYNKVLDYRVEARAGSSSNAPGVMQISDGEEAMLPVLSNRMLVTETLPLNMPNGGTKDFKFEKLIRTTENESLSPYALTVEYTSNPAWYALQSLPWLMEFPYECAEQVFNRFYANALGNHIIKSSPAIRNVFELWKKDSAGLMSNLQKNQELKSVLLQETPWVLESKNEEDQHRNLAMLMDMARMRDELQSILNKLEAMQSGGGGFPWFKEGPDDRYITQY
ncbi:MAG: alpha-2-macroglobulin family protein, partial [Chitinophagales bacterium]